MRYRGTVILLVLGVAVAGFMSVGLVRAAGQEADLGGPIVVTPEPSSAATSSPRSSDRLSGDASLPGTASPSAQDGTVSPSAQDGREGRDGADRTARPSGQAEPHPSERAAERKRRAEPVAPPPPRIGGRGFADDDDGGGDDDDGDDD